MFQRAGAHICSSAICNELSLLRAPISTWYLLGHGRHREYNILSKSETRKSDLEAICVREVCIFVWGKIEASVPFHCNCNLLCASTLFRP